MRRRAHGAWRWCLEGETQVYTRGCSLYRLPTLLYA
jgi:hypothetical protein